MKHQMYGRTVPVLRGGDELDDVLNGIQRELAEANRLAANGTEGAAERVQQLEGERDQLQAQIDAQAAGAGGGGTATAVAQRGVGTETELDRLRALERTQRLQAQAEQIADRVVRGVLEERQTEEQQLHTLVEEMVRRRLSPDVVTRAATTALATQRGGSRFAGDGASGDVLDTLAAGGEVQVQERHANARGAQGELRGVQYMEKNHPLGHMVRALYRIKTHKATEADRVFFERCQQKAMSEGTPSAGGTLVPLEYMPDVLGLLRALAVVRRAGPNFRTFNRQVNDISISSGTTAYYTPENQAGQLSELTFGEAPLLTRHNLMGLVPVSNILLDDAPEAERIIREDMAEVMALREDLAFLRGTGSSGEPRGLRNQVGVTLDPIAPGANGFQPSLFDLRVIRAQYRTQNVRNPRPVWFFNSAFLTYLETLSDTLGRPLLETPLLQYNDDNLTGVLDGIPFYASNQIPANLTQGTSTNGTDLMLVDMSQVYVGTADELEIDVSTETTYWDGTAWVSTFQNRQSLFRGWLSHDIASRRPATIIVQRGVLV